MMYKSFKKKILIFQILRFVLPITSIVACFVVTYFSNSSVSLIITLALAVLAVSSFMFCTNKTKRYALVIEDLVFQDAVKGLYDKKKTTNAAGFLNISELVRNNVLIEPYRRYGFLYYEVVYNRVVIDSSNLTLEYLEDTKKKKKKRTYYGFVGRAIRYELRSHKPLFLVNKKSKYFSVSETICEDDTFNVSGALQNYERLNRNGSLAKLKEYLTKNNDLNLSVFYLPEAIYVLIEGDVVTINPRLTQKIDEDYINSYKEKFKVPREIADILKITKLG